MARRARARLGRAGPRARRATAPRAEALVAELGGEVARVQRRARRSAPTSSCSATSPRSSSASPRRSAARAKGVISILGGVPLAALRAAYGGTPVVRMLPSVPVEVAPGRQRATPATPTPTPSSRRSARSSCSGASARSSTLDEAQIDVAMGLMSCAPAYVALVAEAQVDAGVRAGLPADVAGELVAANIAGTAALLQARGMDTLAVRRDGHLARRVDRARPRRARARRRAGRVRRRDAGGAGAMTDAARSSRTVRDADRGLPQRAAARLHRSSSSPTSSVS